MTSARASKTYWGRLLQKYFPEFQVRFIPEVDVEIRTTFWQILESFLTRVLAAIKPMHPFYKFAGAKGRHAGSREP